MVKWVSRVGSSVDDEQLGVHIMPNGAAVFQDHEGYSHTGLTAENALAMASVAAARTGKNVYVFLQDGAEWNSAWPYQLNE